MAPTAKPDFSAWTDVAPLPQDDGGPNALATIAYAPAYAEATAYLRALMARNEHSPRALALTAFIISLNPAHYTVWLYRAAIVRALPADLAAELAWLNATSLAHLKNYQIWAHRQTLVELLGGVPAGERAFLADMLARDAKNYHVWSYRQWLVRRFALWDGHGERADVERLLAADVRNNSAWNHRWFLVFGRGEAGGDAQETWLREVEFAQAAVRLAPMNESPWAYLRGLMKRRGERLAYLRAFGEEFAGVGDGATVTSSFALDVLADIYAEEEGMQEDARKALDLLADKYDPIRVNYWNYRKSLLGGPSVSA